MKRLERYWAPVMIALAVILISATYQDYGISWDERIQSEYGERTLSYYLSGGADKSCLQMANMKIYGPLFEMAAALAYSGMEGEKYQIRRLLTALMGMAAVAGAGVYAGMISPGAGVFIAALSLAMTPVFYGHCYINSKDIPFAALFVWSMAFVARLIQPGGAPWKTALIGGLVMGLAAAVRPAGAPLLLAMLGLGAAFSIFTGWMESVRDGKASLSERGKGLAGKSLAMAAAAMGLLALFWPLAHEGLFSMAGGIMEGMRFKVAYPTLFDGKIVMSHQLPIGYVLRYYLITTPPGLMVFMFAGMILGAIAIVKDPFSARSGGLFLAIAWFWTPIIFFMAAGANIYDGIRHFLFIMPAGSILAGYGAGRAMEAFGSHRGVAAVILAAAFLPPAWEMARLHPYQYAYFNFMAGGVAGADGRYETEYWATSYKEAMEMIGKDVSSRKSGSARVLTAGNRFNKECAQRFAGPGVIVETTEERFGSMIPPKELSGKDLPPEYDYYLATYRYGLAKAFPSARTLFTVGREGAIFSVVKIPGG